MQRSRSRSAPEPQLLGLDLLERADLGNSLGIGHITINVQQALTEVSDRKSIQTRRRVAGLSNGLGDEGFLHVNNLAATIDSHF